MRKSWLFVLTLFFLLASCQRSQHHAVIDQWADYRKAYNFLGHQNDSAFFYFNRLTNSSKDSQQVAIAYSVMAGMQSDAGDYFGAQENLSLSLKYLDPSDKKNQYSLAKTNNELGMISFNLKRYDEAISFYQTGLRYADHTLALPIIVGNEANVYQQKGNYTEALKLYSRAALLSKSNLLDEARIATNVANTMWLQNRRYNPVPELLRTLKIREDYRDLAGEAFNLKTLADFYSFKQRDSAVYYAKKSLAAAAATGNPDIRLEALSLLIKLSVPKNAQLLFSDYQQLSDSTQTARNAAKNQFALIRYSAEKEKEENLRLQQDNVLKKYQLVRQNMIIIGLILFGGLGTVFGIFWYRKRRHEAVQENQLRLSKKVHDVVANGLYRVIQEIDNSNDFEKEPVVGQLNILYEKSRDIAHEETMTGINDFSDKIRRLLMAFASPDTNVAIVGNEDNVWLAINTTIKNELAYILQEWMVNMKKHSQATSVAVRFAMEDNQLTVVYTDNGIGFPTKIKYGRGLRNTENRIKILNGELIFDNNLNKGVRIRMVIPVT